MPKKKRKKKSKKIKVRKEKRKTEFTLLKRIAIKCFGRLADKYSDRFINVREALITSDAKILFRTYLSLMFLVTFIVFIFTFVLTLLFITYLNLNIIFSIIGLIIMPSFFASIVFLLIYAYPVSITQSRKRDIEANLPFAMTHMSAVAESGAPPLTIFKILSHFKEYGEIAKEAEKITRNVEIFGLDALSAIRDRTLKCPSPSFRDILQGILTTIQSGGNLRAYLKEESGKAIFEYTIRREKYNQLLATYADLYTALLVAAPMIFIVVISTLNVIGGDIFGLSLQDTMILGLGILTFLDIIFLSFIQLTQPRM